MNEESLSLHCSALEFLALWYIKCLQVPLASAMCDHGEGYPEYCVSFWKYASWHIQILYFSCGRSEPIRSLLLTQAPTICLAYKSLWVRRRHHKSPLKIISSLGRTETSGKNLGASCWDTTSDQNSELQIFYLDLPCLQHRPELHNNTHLLSQYRS